MAGATMGLWLGVAATRVKEGAVKADAMGASSWSGASVNTDMAEGGVRGRCELEGGVWEGGVNEGEVGHLHEVQPIPDAPHPHVHQMGLEKQEDDVACHVQRQLGAMPWSGVMLERPHVGATPCRGEETACGPGVGRGRSRSPPES